jgi:hypothetical protein
MVLGARIWEVERDMVFVLLLIGRVMDFRFWDFRFQIEERGAGGGLG